MGSGGDPLGQRGRSRLDRGPQHRLIVDEIVVYGRLKHRNADQPAELAPDVEDADAEGDAGGGQLAECDQRDRRSEEHTSELQSLMRSSYAVFCLKKKIK